MAFPLYRATLNSRRALTTNHGLPTQQPPMYLSMCEGDNRQTQDTSDMQQKAQKNQKAVREANPRHQAMHSTMQRKAHAQNT
jgi:hypothetical protein